MTDKSNDAVRRFFGVEDMETIESLGLRYVVTTALPPGEFMIVGTIRDRSDFRLPAAREGRDVGKGYKG